MDLSPDDEDFTGRLLHQAALWDNIELLLELITTGADVNARDASQRVALHAAALAERSACLVALCGAGAVVDAVSDDATGGKTPLHLAAERGHSENISVLLERGASVAIPDAGGRTARVLAERGGHRHAAVLLVEAEDALERLRLSRHSTLRDLVSRGDINAVRTYLAELGDEAGLVVNLTPGGANTLLYVASEAGNTQVVKILLEAGADGRAHPVTKYCPLYIACYRGHKDAAEQLLMHFPEAVKQETVERWLPLHAACIGGHPTLVTLLLEYKYPEYLLQSFTTPKGERYLAAFDINATDASGQSALYIACTLGNIALVKSLLAHTVLPIDDEVKEQAAKEEVAKTTVPRKKGLSFAIHAIVTKLTSGKSNNKPSPGLSPLSFTPAAGACVSAAVRGQHVAVLKLLLEAGASPDACVQNPREVSASRSRSLTPPRGDGKHEREQFTALALAAYLKNTVMLESLLQAGASDPHCTALKECMNNGLRDIIPLVLATKAQIDTEYKVNKTGLVEQVFNNKNESLTYNSLVPAAPVAVYWKNLPDIEEISMEWLSLSCSRAAPPAPSAPPAAALRALTRVELTAGGLKTLPKEMFSLWSLRYLNVAQNKLESLPFGSDVYTAPVLQDLYLQDNRLEQLPPSIFCLPSLTTLDVGNNKLRHLPGEMWTAPKLRDLNVALNLLRDLPTEYPTDVSPSDGRRTSAQASLVNSKACSRSPSIEQSSDADDEAIPVIGDRTGNAVCQPIRPTHRWTATISAPVQTAGSPLTTLNLSHNRLGRLPAVLACRAPNLTSLNMAYNCLRSMSYITSYPSSLRQLDLSHNEITCWFSLPQIETLSLTEDPLQCYCISPLTHNVARRPASGQSARTQLLNAACPPRRHLTLASLRTLILSNNMLTRIQLTTDDDGSRGDEYDCSRDDDEWSSVLHLRPRLMFPALSMLDMSCNLLRAVPAHIHALTNLAVLNLSGNKELSTLPPSLGLLPRVWSVSVSGCALSGPLARVAAAPDRRSAQVLAYLRSQLHEASGKAQPRLALLGDQGIGKTTLLECLRQESAPGFRRKPTEHWTKRMGNKASAKGNLSTVGVDVGLWVYEKARSTRGHVTFRTWDFGGQREYYATHQYFLSRRTLYLVVWKANEGRKSLNGAINWLRSIQGRAPGSPVIMVATHYDQVPNANLPESESPEALQRYIRTEIMSAPDADKLGLPKVVDSVEVSCATKHNIRLLADIIYTAAFSIKAPGSKEPLLEERIPASYVNLEECVLHIAAELQAPVVTAEQFKRMVTQYFQQKGYKMFRDSAELHQATMYLHENGVLLHYDDANLKELYFLSPQWLCDVLAHVVTIKEINPFAPNGIMKIDDLSHVLKASPLLSSGDEASTLALSLLNKFELALSWDSRSLLVPPLLPDVPPDKPQLLLKTRGSIGGRRWATAAPRQTDSPTLVSDPPSPLPSPAPQPPPRLPYPRRYVLMSYSPRGFWPRLCCRLLADDILGRESGPESADVQQWGWLLWSTGMSLVSGEHTYLTVRETKQEDLINTRFSILSDGYWCHLDPNAGACLEISISGGNNMGIEPTPAVLARLLATISDHIDLLLEDWYPSLGTRFVHTSEGRCLITRVCPCPYCLSDPVPQAEPEGLDEELKRVHAGFPPRVRLSVESRASDQDSGVGAESNASSRIGSTDRPPLTEPYIVYGWTFEQCVLYGQKLHCPIHKEIDASLVSPDTLLLDVPPSLMYPWSSISVRSVLGRGAFGTVLGGRARGRAVAVKALQPAPPPATATAQYKQAYVAAVSRWEREGAAAACRAYCALRQELAIMSLTRHSNVASLAGVCREPLALLLPQAPLGALDANLRLLRAAGARYGPRVVRLVALQVARALEYLHAKKIVYRDLKSENVLVWSLPKPEEAIAAERSEDSIDVHVKLGDYGISRLALPSGTKGFGGTEGFMAPEIMRYNGEEEYNEKVDCFSYGMLLYELVTLRQPYEGHEAVKDAILEGVRPPFTTNELQYPCSILETIHSCWSLSANIRPSAAVLASIASAAEYIALQQATDIGNGWNCSTVSCVGASESDPGGWEIYLGDQEGRVKCLLVTSYGFHSQHTFNVPPDKESTVAVTAMCQVNNRLWLTDSAGRILVYSIASLSLQWASDLYSCVGGGAAAAAALLPLTHIGRVAVGLRCGRLFLVSSERPEPDASFVLTELGTATELVSLAALPTDYGYELWAAGSGIQTYSLTHAGVKSAHEVTNKRVKLLAAGEGRVVAVFYDAPCVVQQVRPAVSPAPALRCSRLVPHSETIGSIQLDDGDMQEANMQVCSLLVCAGVVLCGCVGGSTVVATGSLRPLSVFRPHCGQVSHLLPLPPHRGSCWWWSVASIGAGYRPLLPRFVQQSATKNQNEISQTNQYCLLWRANRWLPD